MGLAAEIYLEILLFKNMLLNLHIYGKCIFENLREGSFVQLFLKVEVIRPVGSVVMIEEIS